MIRSRLARLALPLAAVLILVLLPACGRLGVVGRGYDNFTAYYNKFYNAKQSFEEGTQALEEGEGEEIDRSVYLRVYPDPERSGSALAHFNDVIERAPDVLREHPNSRWVDDALLLIGKSYFYLLNYVGAQQKFREVIDEVDSGLKSEARFWLARTLVAQRQFEAAENEIEASLLREDLDEDWRKPLQLLLGDLYAQRGQWEEAADALRAGLEGDVERARAARGRFLLAQVLETQEQFAEAAEAYRSVIDERPLFPLLYAAQVEAVRVEGQHGDPARALDNLRRLERDDKYYDYRSELALLRGLLYQEDGDAESALTTYRTLLYDEENPPQTRTRALTHYRLGQLYEDAYRDYLLAAVHYDTAATALTPRQQRSTTTNPPTPAAVTDAQERSEMFGRYADLASRLAEMDSLLYLGSLDTEAFQAEVQRLRELRYEEMQAEAEAEARRAAERRFEGGVQTRNTSRNTPPGAADRGAAAEEDGFLFHRNPTQLRESFTAFVDLWGERPLVRNWRRLEAVRAATLDDEAGADARALVSPDVLPGAADRLPDIDVSAVPRDEARQNAMMARRALVRYELGNVLFLQMSRPDSAAAWYRTVLVEDPDEPVAERAYYALAEVQRALGDSSAATQLYEEILERYPDGTYARRAAAQLGREIPATAITDTMAVATAAYTDARSAWEAGRYHDALRRFVVLTNTYPEAPTAPQALLAAGTTYLAWAREDTLDILDPLPLPDSTLAPYRAAASLAGGDAPAAPRPDRTQQDGPPASAEEQEELERLRRARSGRPDPVDTETPAERRARLRAREAEGEDALLHRREPADDAQAGSVDDAILLDERPVDDAPDAPDDVVPVRSPAAEADTTATAPTALTAPADADTTASSSLATPVRVTALYAALVERYPDTEEARRASLVLTALQDLAQARADSLAALQDSLAAPIDTVATSLSDSTLATPSDSTLAPAGTTMTPRTEDAPPDSSAVRPPAPDTSGTVPDDVPSAATRRPGNR